jgi:diguanylate cyclase (GGDEF)-like protein
MQGSVTQRPAQRDLVGLGLVVSGALLVIATVWLLPASHGDQILASLTALATAVVALAWLAVSRFVRHPRLVLGYPVITMLGLACLGWATTDIASSYTGVLTLAFIYLGLFAPPGSTFPLVAPAVACWLIANGALAEAPLGSLLVRLPVAVIIWVTIGVLLSRHSQATVRDAAILRRQALRDPLTGLRNRRVLDDLLLTAVPGDAVVLLDIDHFKQINDDRGHNDGDRILVDFARVLIRGVRDQDAVVRFGGDEFVVVLPGTELRDVDNVIRRIHDDWSAHEPTVTFSGGAAAVRAGHDGSDAFGEADRLLYQAKAEGRDQWATADIAGRQQRAVGI